jgi:hypothetical protein
VSLAKDFRSLSPEMRMAAAAAGALAVSLILPWYQKSYFQGQKVVQANVSALGVFTFVEAAVLLVAFAVLFLVWARSQRKAFHLPGGDGVAITLAGGWALLLLVWRLFDKPDIPGIGVTVGIQWGIFGALLAAGALVVAGARVRAAHRPEPPNPKAEEVDWVAPARPAREPRPDRRPREGTSDVFRERPAWEGEVGEPPRRARRDDDAETQRMAGDDAETRRMGASDDAETRRFRDDDAETRRFRDDDPRTQRLPPEDAAPPDPPDSATRRLPRDDELTQRLWDDEERPRDDDSPRLWRDDR